MHRQLLIMYKQNYTYLNLLTTALCYQNYYLIMRLFYMSCLVIINYVYSLSRSHFFKGNSKQFNRTLTMFKVCNVVITLYESLLCINICVMHVFDFQFLQVSLAKGCLVAMIVGSFIQWSILRFRNSNIQKYQITCLASSYGNLWTGFRHVSRFLPKLFWVLMMVLVFKSVTRSDRMLLRRCQ